MGSTGSVTANRSERPCEDHVGRAVGGPGECDEVAGQLPDPRLLLAGQRAELLLYQVDPMAGDRVDVEGGQASHRCDPARIDALQRSLAEIAAVELAAGVEEVRRV